MSFPFIFGRMASEPVSTLDILKPSDSFSASVATYVSLEAAIRLKSSALIDKIYNLIQGEKDSKKRNRLLTLKRAIFNSRRFENYIHEFSDDKYNRLANDLEEHAANLTALQENLHIIKSEYNAHITDVNKNLLALASRANIKNGLLFASDHLTEYTRRAVLEKKELKQKAVISLLKYITRSIVKTTPFSTFNSSFCLEYGSGHFVPVAPAKKINIRINNLVFHAIKKILLNDPRVRCLFEIRINTSVLLDSDHYFFLINKDNSDFVKRMKYSDVGKRIRDLVENKKLLHGELVRFLVTTFDEETIQAEAFVGKLLDEGFLIPIFPISFDDIAWPTRLAEFLATHLKTDLGYGEVLKDFLYHLETTRHLLETVTDYETRRRALHSAGDKFKELRAQVQAYDASAQNYDIPYSDLFYEDIVKTQSALPLKNSKTTYLNLKTIKRQLSFPDLRSAMRSQLRDQIKDDVTPLLNVYATFCNMKATFDAAINKFLNNEFLKHDSPFQTVISAIEQCEQNTLNLENVPVSTDSSSGSETGGFYIQLISRENDETLVINNDARGYGKSITRFLNAYSDDVVTKIKNGMHIKNPGIILSDMRDSSIHNTNIYPSLCDLSIDIPGGKELYDDEKKIKLNELLVVKKNNDLSIQWKNQYITPIHFSMESIDRKSSLIKFLDIFSPSEHAVLPTIKIIEDYFIYQIQSDASRLNISLPRLVFNNIVVNRKKWFIKKESIPCFFGEGASFSEILPKLALWKSSLALPDEVFVVFSRRYQAHTDLHKPQYINFTLPVLVQCFVSLLEKSESIIEVSEMLPKISDVEAATDAHVCEYIVDLTC